MNETFKVGDHVTVDGYRGVVFYVHEFPKVHADTEYDQVGDKDWEIVSECDIEWYGRGECSCPEDPDNVIVVMVGDDHEHHVSVDDLTLHEGHVCSCGQLGCAAEVGED